MRKGLVRFAVAALALLVLLVAIAAIRVWTFPVGSLAEQTPDRTALMRQREREASSHDKRLRIDQRWIGYRSVSPLLRRAILVAEDDAFFSHDGLDWNEIQASARENWKKKRIVRGGSTITQQLAKNLYLGDARTVTRKLEEALLAMRLEHALSKRRIFELYLNLIEWGDGIFGAEAAARRYYGVPASALSERQAVLLAAVIINPRRFSATHPDRRIERRVRLIASRLRRRGFLNADQYAAAIGQAPPPRPSFFQWLFGGKPKPSPAPEPPPETPPEPETEAPSSPAPADSASTDTTALTIQP